MNTAEGLPLHKGVTARQPFKHQARIFLLSSAAFKQQLETAPV